jgi:ATP-dependent Clp protease ATP-binding subunit ClpC
MEAKFSPEVKEVISNSREEALRLNHDTIGVEHLILGLLRDNDNVAVKVLQSLEINPVLLRRSIEQSMKDRPAKKIHDPKSLPLTKQAEKSIENHGFRS